MHLENINYIFTMLFKIEAAISWGPIKPLISHALCRDKNNLASRSAIILWHMISIFPPTRDINELRSSWKSTGRIALAIVRARTYLCTRVRVIRGEDSTHRFSADREKDDSGRWRNTQDLISVIPEMWGMITWVMVGLLLAAETCGRNVLSGNGNGKEETKQKEGLKGVTADEEDIYRGYRCRGWTQEEVRGRERAERRQTDLWFTPGVTRAYPPPPASPIPIRILQLSSSNPPFPQFRFPAYRSRCPRHFPTPHLFSTSPTNRSLIYIHLACNILFWNIAVPLPSSLECRPR